MTGTIINASTILAGGICGLLFDKQLSPVIQQRLKSFLGLMIIYVGLTTTFSAMNGGVLRFLKQLGLISVALIVGNLIGKLVQLQKRIDKLGSYAQKSLLKAGADQQKNMSEGLVTASLLFCVGPMALLGSLQDGLQGDYRTLAIKSVMDGIATIFFVNTFGWGVILSIIPLVAYQGSITLLSGILAEHLPDPSLLDPINATGGLLILCTSLIIFDFKRVPIADYLPSLLIAALFIPFW